MRALATGNQRSKGSLGERGIQILTFHQISSTTLALDMCQVGLPPCKDHISLEPNNCPPSAQSLDGLQLWKMNFTELSIPACHSVTPQTVT